MRMFVAMVMAVCVSGAGMVLADDVTISEIMKKGHKGKTSLIKKVTSNKASDAEKKQLLGWYKAMAKMKPEKGDAESWNQKTAALVVAMEAVVAGDSKGVAALKKASNCKACHNEHK